LPDDPWLGEFRREFAGMLGTLEEHPDDKSPTFRAPGFVEIVDSDDLIEKLAPAPATRWTRAVLSLRGVAF
jgi:hypothetical protein